MRPTSLFFSTIAIGVLCAAGVLITSPITRALLDEGGPIIYTYPFPCYSQFGFGYWTIKLTNNPGVPTPIPVIYPYLPPTITKLDFLPAFVGTSTVSKILPAGACATVAPCFVGLCPITLFGATSIQHGIAVQTP